MIHCQNNRSTIVPYLAVLAILTLSCLALPTASAYSVINGEITPAQTPTLEPTPTPVLNNSKYDSLYSDFTIIRKIGTTRQTEKLNETYVHQGDTVCSGYTYDLSGVWGFSGAFGWWKNWWDEDTVYPQHTNKISGQPHLVRSVTLDEENWPIGNWYQMDYYRSDSADYSDPNWTYDFRKGNDFAFKIQYCPYSFSGGMPGSVSNGYSGEGNTVNSSGIKIALPTNITGDISHAITSSDLTDLNVTYSTNATMYIQSGNTTIEVPVTVQATAPAEVKAVIDSANGKTVTVPQQEQTGEVTAAQTTIPLPTETLEFVTPKSPVPIGIIIIAIAIGGIILWARRH